MSDSINSLEFENILIKYLLSNKTVRERCIYFLDVRVFSNKENKEIIKLYLKLHEEYNKFPTASEIKLSIKNETVLKKYKEILDKDVSEYDEQFVLDALEDFFRRKIVWNCLSDFTVNLEENELGGISPDHLREALSFSFDSEVGLDFFENSEEIYESLHRSSKVIPTGIAPLDLMLDGGFEEKTLSIFMGETNVGKSLTLCSLASSCLLQNKNVLYITLEMSKHKVARRIIANIFDTDINELSNIDKDSFLGYFEKFKTTHPNRFFVQEFPGGKATCNHYRNLLKELKIKKKFVPDIIMVDYLELMGVEGRTNKNTRPDQEEKKKSEELRSLSQETSIPIVTAMQTNRDGYGNDKIDLTNMADSIGPAKTSDTIIGITQSEELREANKYKFFLLKFRDGSKNNKGPIVIDVDYSRMKLYFKSKDEYEQERYKSAFEKIKNTAKENRKEEKKKIVDFGINC